MGELMTDITQIPLLFENLYHSVYQISLYLIFPLLTLSILDENISGIEGRASYLGVFIRLVLIAGLLLIYNQFFMTVVQSIQYIADSIIPRNEFFETLKKVFEEVPKAKTWNFFTFAKINIMASLTVISYVLAFVAVKVFFLARFAFLSLLFVLGPILIVFGIYKRTAIGFYGWLKSLFHVSSWAVVIALLIRLVAVLNQEAVINFKDSNILVVFALNLFVTLLFIFTPFITSSLLSGGSIGGISSAMIGLASAGSFAVLRRFKGVNHKHIKPGH